MSRLVLAVGDTVEWDSLDEGKHRGRIVTKQVTSEGPKYQVFFPNGRYAGIWFPRCQLQWIASNEETTTDSR